MIGGADENTLRTDLTREQRCLPLPMTIDPGFVHQNKIQLILGDKGMAIIDEGIARIPDMPEGLRRARIDNVYAHVFTSWCGVVGIRSLQDTLGTQNGRMFCSTEHWHPCREIKKQPRALLRWRKPRNCEFDVEVEFSTERVHSDTLRSRIAEGNTPIAVIGEHRWIKDKTIRYEAIVMGSPWVETRENVGFDPIWYSYDFFENYVEDFDEFAKVASIPTPKDSKAMRSISELAFKTCIARLIGGTTEADWGGEQSDFYSSHLHLGGRRVKGAFLFKGPARFSPMTLNNLGKNNDQIVRLSHEPADILVVQHCHDIRPAVRKTLRAFAVQPSRPRRYCLIDGRDSLRLLTAYNLYDEAVKLSKRTNKRIVASASAATS